MPTNELHYWLSFSAFLKIGPMKFKKLLGYFGNAEYAFFASAQNLLRAGIEEKIVEEFVGFRQRFRLDQLLAILEKEHIAICPVTSENYPPLLKHIHNPPFLLYIKGNNAVLKNTFAVGVVGTRGATTYGLQVANEISRELSQQSITVVSGGALGIDRAAHEGALKGQGNTVVVLPGGIDEASFAPQVHSNLFKKIIASGGAIISEFPPTVAAQPFLFPQRNRIISGMTLGTVVVEAPQESGALITAQYALDQNREVFVVPGQIYHPNTVGGHRLIQQGAQLVTCTKDILDSLQLTAVVSKKEVQQSVPTDPQEQKILSCLSKEPIHVDALVARSGLPASNVNATLTTLEMKGIIRNMGGMNYITL